MLEHYYNLNADPFRLTPDSRFVYPHPSYIEIRESMHHALQSGDGLLALTGRPGTGKSTMIEWFLGEFKKGEVQWATLSSTNVEGEDLLRMVAYAFGLEAKGLDKSTLVLKLRQQLQEHRRSLLVIDEAQNLSASALEEVQMLTDLQADSRPLLQIFLVGQDRLHERLHDPEMEPL
ncbi:MAG: ATP-binding protein, partial [Halioglobus sp.]